MSFRHILQIHKENLFKYKWSPRAWPIFSLFNSQRRKNAFQLIKSVVLNKRKIITGSRCRTLTRLLSFKAKYSLLGVLKCNLWVTQCGVATILLSLGKLKKKTFYFPRIDSFYGYCEKNGVKRVHLVLAKLLAHRTPAAVYLWSSS